ncbi:MAG: hypothetical protein ACM3YN_11810 [Parcubacteria group bacterium]
MSELNQQGRKDNAAQPLGDMKGIESEKAEKKTAERERRSAGPDGPRATEVTGQRKRR